MTDTSGLPDVDALFPEQPLPDVDSLFPEHIEQENEQRRYRLINQGSPVSTPVQDFMMSENGPVGTVFHSAGNVVRAFGNGFGESLYSATGLSDQSKKELKEWSGYDTWTEKHKELAKAASQVLLDKPALQLSAAWRAMSGLFTGGQAAVAQIGEEVGQQRLGREIAAIPEAFQGSPHQFGVPHPAEVAKARALGVIGPDGEAGWKGTARPAEEAVSPAEPRSAEEPPPPQVQAENAAAAAERPSPAAPVAPPDIHAAARQIDPDTFRDYDSLTQRRDTFRRWIDELRGTRDQQYAAGAPNADEIARLQGRIDNPDTTPRLRKKYQARLEPLVAERDAYMANAPATDSADMAKIREHLQSVDYQMRDLAPKVSAAYRSAAERYPDLATVAEPKRPTAEPRISATELRSVRARGEQEHMLSPESMMEPESYHGFHDVAQALPDDINEQFQVHGLLVGDRDANLIDLLEHGIDPNREFHAGHPHGGMHGVDSTRTYGAPYLLISDRGKTLRETGVKNVVLNGPAEANIDALRKAYPNVNFMTAAEADLFMKIGKTPETARVPAPAPSPTPSRGAEERPPQAAPAAQPRTDHEAPGREAQRHEPQPAAALGAAEAPAVAAKPPEGVPEKPVRTIEEQRDFIKNDVVSNLMRAGISREIAEHEAVFQTEQYTLLSKRVPSLGTPEEIYRREHAEILRGSERSKQSGHQPEYAPRAPRKVDEEKLSLLQFLARRGGLKRTADLEAMLGKDSRLFRKDGMTEDRAREAASEAGYLVENKERTGNQASIRDLHAAINAESRGRKVYRQGMERAPEIDMDHETHLREQEEAASQLAVPEQILRHENELPSTYLKRSEEILGENRARMAELNGARRSALRAILRKEENHDWNADKAHELATLENANAAIYDEQARAREELPHHMVNEVLGHGDTAKAVHEHIDAAAQERKRRLQSAIETFLDFVKNSTPETADLADVAKAIKKLREEFISNRSSENHPSRKAVITLDRESDLLAEAIKRDDSKEIERAVNEIFKAIDEISKTDTRRLPRPADIVRRRTPEDESLLSEEDKEALASGELSQDDKGPERIVSAAVIVNGKVYTAPVHAEAFDKAFVDQGGKPGEYDQFVDKHWTPGKGDGFITSKGRYVERDEAYRIADRAAQVPDELKRKEPWLEAREYEGGDKGPTETERFVAGVWEGDAAKTIARIRQRYTGEGVDKAVKLIQSGWKPPSTAGVPIEELGNRELFQRETVQQIETPAFKQWFGDSKIVNEAGKPLVVYHGTGDLITEFDLDHPNRHDSGWLGTGIYLTTNPGLAGEYAFMKKESAGPNVMPLFARVENPYHATSADKLRLSLIQFNEGLEAARKAADEWTAELKAQGYDGVILEYTPKQITEKAMDDPVSRAQFWANHTGGRDAAVTYLENVLKQQNRNAKNYDAADVEITRQAIDYLKSGADLATKGGDREVVVFDPAGVKSATGNRGTFDPNNTSVLYQRQRPTEPSAIHEIPGLHIGPDFLSPDELYQIKAYHGSPHDFDRFDISKIGTGEGNQAYGHGLYLAESEGVAKDYRDKLSDKGFAGDKAQKYLADAAGDAQAAIETLKAHAEAYRGFEPGTAEILEEAVKLLESGWTEPTGKMYQVSIKAEPEHFLDWDKPLNEQPPNIQEALEGLEKNIKNKAFWRITENDLQDIRREQFRKADTVQDLIGALERGTSQEEATRILREAGIPGIKYLDQGSRSTGEGSRNYVVFDDKLIDITHKDGTPVTDAERKEITDSLFQRSQKHSAKGSYAPITPEQLAQGIRPLLRIRPGADATTIAHEFSHEYLQQFQRTAEHPEAPPILKEDWNETLKWLGAKDASELYERTANGLDLTARATRMHEKFARGEEAFRMEGRAPSQALARVFRQFAEWMRNIYKSLQELERQAGFKIGLTDRMREVYGRRYTEELDWQDMSQRTVIAPEREAPKSPGAQRLAEAEMVAPEKTAEHAAGSEQKIGSIAAENLIPEERHELLGTENSAPSPTDRAPSAEHPKTPSGGAKPEAFAREGRGAAGTGAAVPGGSEGTPEGAGTPANAAERGAGRKAAGPVATEPPPAANAPFAGPKSPLIDKAGNIRLDKLDTPDDVTQVIRDAAAANENFIEQRRGVLHDFETLELADALGMDPAWLDRKKIGEAFSVEEIRAARRLLVQSATAVRDAMIAAKDGTIEAAIKLGEVMRRHEMVQARVAQATAEAGRALRAFREVIPGAENVALVDTWLKQNTGRSLFQLQEMARYGANLTKPSQISRFVHDTANGGIKQAIVFYYVNALISGPITHLRYAAGNALMALYTPIIKIPIAAGIGAGRRLLGGDAERVYIGETGAQLYGLLKGSREGFKAALEGWKSGNTPHLPGEGEVNMFEAQPMAPPIPGVAGRIIGIPGKSVGAIHGFFSAIRYQQEIHGMAYRTAMQEGLNGDAFAARIADLTNRPTTDMMEKASTTARRDLYMAPSDYQSLEAKLARISNHNIATKVILPFVKIGTQITARAFEGTPLAPFQAKVRENLSGKNGAPARDMQLATIAGGTALMGTMVGMVLEGNATGDGPSDPGQRAVWLLNHHPNSIQIGNVSVSYARLGSLAMLMRTAANATEAYRGWGDDEGHTIAGEFLYGFEKAILEEGFLTGIKDMIDAIYHHEEYGQRYLAQMVTNWLPWSIGFGQVARLPWIDPYQRETRGSSFMDALWKDIEAKVPWGSRALYPRRDMFGEPIPQSGPVQNYANDRVVQIMDSLHVKVGRLQRKLRGVDLTDVQYDNYARTAGRTTKVYLNNLMQSGFEHLPKGIQVELITKAVEAGRKIGADSIIASSIGSSNDIMQKATQAKQEKLLGKPQTIH